MKTRAAITLGLSAIALAGTLAGVATQVSGMAFASARDESRAEPEKPEYEQDDGNNEENGHVDLLCCLALRSH